MAQGILFEPKSFCSALSLVCLYQFALGKSFANKVLFLLASLNVGGIIKSSFIGCLKKASTEDSSRGGSAVGSSQGSPFNLVFVQALFVVVGPGSLGEYFELALECVAQASDPLDPEDQNPAQTLEYL